MAWIESHQELARHPKTKRLARSLGAEVPAVIGYLHLLWWWALDYAPDGSLEKYDAGDIADAVLWQREPGEFVEAMVKAGFFDRLDDGSLLIHDWYDYAGRLLESRQTQSEAGARGNHERWHVRRGVFDPDCPYCQEERRKQKESDSLSNRPPTRKPSGANRVLSHRTVPNHTEPNTTSSTPTPPSPPTEGDGGSEGAPPGSQKTMADAVVVMDEVIEFWQQNIHVVITDYQVQSLHAYVDRGMEPACVLEALKRAVGQNKRTLSYVEGILRRWETDGVKTLEDIQALDQSREFERKTRNSFPDQDRPPPQEIPLSPERQRRSRELTEKIKALAKKMEVPG